MKQENKITLAVLLVLLIGLAVGSLVTSTYYAQYIRSQQSKVNIRLIGTPNYTAVDSRDEHNIIFYINTNCNAN